MREPGSRSYRLRAVAAIAAIVLGAAANSICGVVPAPAAAQPSPQPLIAKGKPVDWWFVFKLNSSKPFSGCGANSGQRMCPFGGEPPTKGSFGQQFAVASRADPKLEPGKGCYGDPKVCGSSANCNSPWGHSKGLLAWNNDGDGFIMQVSTPSWPGSGSVRIKRKSGNTLGCVKTNNNLIASQHFFALKLNKDDLLKVLEAMRTASVATNPSISQVVFNGGPKDVRDAVFKLGKKPSKNHKFAIVHDQLSTKVRGKQAILIAKPSNLHVPPWQLALRCSRACRHARRLGGPSRKSPAAASRRPSNAGARKSQISQARSRSP